MGGAAGVDDALTLLDGAEAASGVPLVDEAERDRLTRLASGDTDGAPGWHSLLAWRAGVPVGYAGAVLPVTVGAPGVADLALARDRGSDEAALAALLAGLEMLARRHDVGRLQVWMRDVGADDVGVAGRQGYGVDRRLAVLGRRLDELDTAPTPATDVTIRAYRPGDDEAVVEVLRAAYAGTPDGGWDLAAFRERTDWSWFRPADLLVAEDATGRLLGLHWLKRRSADVGEVYNLAVHPDAQGRDLGPALLAAGLGHLRASGCAEVLLWVDMANERAVRLYRSRGFDTRWEEVALGRTLR